MSHRAEKYGERISQGIRNTVCRRCHAITKAINMEFCNSISDVNHSIYVGSYGRNTAISTSDIDILVELPSSQFDRFNNLSGNGQSRLLQAVKNAILNTYPRSDVRADGQVVKINFADGMYFEIVPAFKNILWNDYWDGTYKYPDTNNGGNWRSTNPKSEQDAMADKNRTSNGLMYDTCKHIRSIRDNNYSSYHLSGIIIDSFVYNAIGNWRWLNSGETSSQPSVICESILLDYYNQQNYFGAMSLRAPGSNDPISTSSSMECLGKVLRIMI